MKPDTAQSATSYEAAKPSTPGDYVAYYTNPAPSWYRGQTQDSSVNGSSVAS